MGNMPDGFTLPGSLLSRIWKKGLSAYEYLRCDHRPERACGRAIQGGYPAYDHWKIWKGQPSYDQIPLRGLCLVNLVKLRCLRSFNLNEVESSWIFLPSWRWTRQILTYRKPSMSWCPISAHRRWVWYAQALVSGTVHPGEGASSEQSSIKV